jgi:hypothetical protein
MTGEQTKIFHHNHNNVQASPPVTHPSGPFQSTITPKTPLNQENLKNSPKRPINIKDHAPQFFEPLMLRASLLRI